MPVKPSYEELENQIAELKKKIKIQQEIENTLKEELFWRSVLIEQSRDGIVILNNNGKVIEANKRFAEILGYTLDEIYGLHVWDWDFQYPVDRILEMIKSIDSKGAHFETKHRRKDGSIIDVELSNNALTLKNEKLILCICRDVTERNTAEKALKESEENYKQLFINSPAAIYRIDFKNGKFVSANDVFFKYYGCKPEELTSLNPFQFLTDDSKEIFRQRLEKMARGEKVSETVEFEVLNRDGRHWHVQLNTRNIYDDEGRIIGYDVVAHDITSLKQMQIALRESEQRLSSIISTSQEWIWTMDRSGMHTFCNPAVENILGYRPEEITGKPILNDIVHEDDIPASTAILEESIAEKKGWTNKIIRWKHRDGSIRYLESNATVLLDKAGEVCGFQGSDRDVTIRYLAEEAIRRSEERYRTIFENTSTANIIISADNTILMANKNFEGLCGFSREQLEGKVRWDSFVHADDLEKMNSYHRLRITDPASVPSSYEIRSIGRKNGIRELLLSASIIPGTDETIVSLTDITEWKKAVEAKRESDHRLQEFTEFIPEGFIETDAKGLLTYINSNGLEKFEYTPGDIAKGVSIFDTVIPEDIPRLTVRFKRLMQGEKSGISEYTAISKTGNTFPILVNSKTMFVNGMPSGIRGFVINITEKKNLENQLARSQKMQAIGTLAGGIAHDFNNLLMGILGNISLILMKCPPDDPVYNRLKNIEEYVRRGSSLTNQLLGFAHGGKYEVKPTDLGIFVKESSEMFGRTRKDIHIHHKAEKILWTVDIDRGQFEQVLLNLFVNASHAMPDGGELYLSELNVELDAEDVIPYEISPGRFVKVTVTDTGTGMDESVIKRIFEPFFTTKEAGKGTGLGLASAYGIIRNHGGFIQVESEKGFGTTFIIYIPVSDSGSSENIETKKEITHGHERVLLIDDEVMILDVTSGMLEELGYSVLTASGGINGLHLYDKNRDNIDLVILDMIMPNFTGSYLFEAILKIKPSARILLSTGYSIDSQARELINKGCRGFIQKPFVITELSAKIREVLDKE